MSDINLGIIGAGSIANEHLRVIFDIKHLDLYGITSKTNKNSFKLKKKYKIGKVFKNYIDLSKDKNIHALIILVPPDKSYSILKSVISCGKKIFIEKPAGLNLKEAKKLKELKNKYKADVMIGFNRRYYSIFRKVKDQINKSDKILGLVVEGHERIWKVKNLYSKKILKNWLFSNSSHTIDLIRFFGGEIKKINIFNNNESSTDLNLSANFITKQNIIGSYHSLWNSPGVWSVKIYCRENSYIFQPLEKCYKINKKFIKKEIRPDNFDLIYKPGFYKQMLDFKNFILNKKTINKIYDLDESYNTMQLINRFCNEQ